MFIKDDENEGSNDAVDVSADSSAEQTERSVTDDTETADDDPTASATDDTDSSSVDDETDENATTFSRSYVEKLRRENANYRERANTADQLAARLHTALVAATGRMADPTDLAFDAAHLDDDGALSGAIDELLAAKPHLASRRVFGDVGQGNRGGLAEPPVNLADMLRART